jgi:hypothetical protein
LVEVAKRMAAMKITAMRGTIKNGEERMCTGGTPYEKVAERRW